MKQKILLTIYASCLLLACENTKNAAEKNKSNLVVTKYQEQFRPQYHFTPETAWMNDPNGLVYNKGIYHLFYQHYQNANVWGPMHWGHATSKDMLHWEQKPIALFPDEKGFIFSGSAVVDENNTSGFGKDGEAPLVAIYTYFRLDIEKAGGINTQTQGIAYSLDNGDTWTKYQNNPVLDNTTMKDFRDPKVFWHQGTESWIMALVAGDHAKFYRSENLKEWNHLSDFGKEQGAHGGVWECPDLFKLKVEGSDEEKWVLIISIGSGGPNGGSGTQYFVGDFDGDNFTSDQTAYKWLDWGTDNYAGVTYNNTPNNERVFIGWMSNWQYALKTPTNNWRSAMTLPRNLALRKTGESYYLVNYPVAKVQDLESDKDAENMFLKANGVYTFVDYSLNQSLVSFTTQKNDFKLSFGNSKGEEVVVLLDSKSNLLMLDRTTSGKTDFNYEFGNKLHYMAMNDLPDEFEVKIYLDRSSIEIFIDKGLYVMTALIFPSESYTTGSIMNLTDNTIQLNDFKVSPLKSIW